MSQKSPRILLIRFSSFGDITQCLSVPTRLKELHPEAEVHWVTRSDFAEIVGSHPAVDKVWSLDRKAGLRGLLKLIRELYQQKFTHVYDAHNNLRSHLISFLLNPVELLRKSQKRWKRLLLFRFRINRFEQPFSGQRDLLEPLMEWGLSKELPAAPQLFLTDQQIERARLLLGPFASRAFVAIAASAAYPLKRWPLEHWENLLRNSDKAFVLLGGPEDQFLEQLAAIAPDRILNLAGKTSLLESAAVIARCEALVANDTGLLHVAEQLGKNCVALMGPAPFGFPSRPTTTILQLPLRCRPCSKHGQGPCTNQKYQQCLVDILPSQVQMELEKRTQLARSH